jgi:hypothetical protein
MNIFVVDNNPVTAALQLCDQHVVKMLIENCQMLSAVFEDDFCGHPKSVHKHPCTLWLKESKSNVSWLLWHHSTMLKEYTHRYKKVHKYDKLDSVYHFTILNQHSNLPDIPMTPFANATPYKDIKDTVEAYRTFYNKDKSRFARWKYTNKPTWFLSSEDRAKDF